MKHELLEKHSLLLLAAILLVVAVGGIVEIVPLFYLGSTIEQVKGVRPYSPLELAGRDIYLREGCYNCHTQMIRSLRDEVERYGHYSLAAESMYDHPFQWGSKRTGPDLARVGGKYSDAWHVEHLANPPAVVQGSVMPGYPFLAARPLSYDDIGSRMAALRLTGVPYTDDMIARAKADLEAQTMPDTPAAKEMLARYPKAQVRKFDGRPEGGVSEADALIAYLQILGTLADIPHFEAKGPNLR